MSNTVQTLGQMVDHVYELLQITPYSQYPIPGAVGTTPPLQPDPPAAVIIQFLNDAVDTLNRLVRCGPVSTIQPINASGAQSTDLGPYYIFFDTDLVNSNDVNEVNSAAWIDSITGQAYRLQPYSYYQNARVFTPFQQFQPARLPMAWELEGNAISLLPPPMYPGQLILKVQEGLQDLVNLTDTIPANSTGPSFQTPIIYYAAMLCSARQAQDVEASDRYQKYMQLAMDGYAKVYEWKNGVSPDAMQTVQDAFRSITMGQITAGEQMGLMVAPSR